MKSQSLATTGRAHIKAPMDRQANRVFLDANSALLQPNPSGIPLDCRLAGRREIHLPASRVCAHRVEDSRAVGSRAHRGTLRPHPWLTYQISKRRGWTPSPETRAGCSDRERSTQDPRSATVSRAHSLIHAVPDRTCMCLRARGMRRSSPGSRAMRSTGRVEVAAIPRAAPWKIKLISALLMAVVSFPPSPRVPARRKAFPCMKKEQCW